MRIFAISDLHLALAEDKPMEVFGTGWEDYMRRIRENWQQTVSSDDLVLLPGDISWVTYLNDAGPDFQYIETLPDGRSSRRETMITGGPPKTS